MVIRVDLIHSSERISMFHAVAKRCSTCRTSKQRLLRDLYKVADDVIKEYKVTA